MRINRMNTTGITEMGDPNDPNTHPAKTFKNKWFPSNKKENHYYSENKLKRFRQNPNLNSKKKDNPRNLKRAAAFRLFVVPAIVDAMKVLFQREQIMYAKSKNLPTLEDFEAKRSRAEEKIFKFINSYYPLQGRSMIIIIDDILDRMKKILSQPEYKDGWASKIMEYMNKPVYFENIGKSFFLPFWGNILPKDEEELEKIRKKYMPKENNIYGLSQNYISEEKNPMFNYASPNASSLPIPSNFKPLNTNGGGRRHKTRKTYKSKHTTRRNK